MSTTGKPVDPMKLMGMIVNRGQGTRAAAICQKAHLPFQFISLGTGTASSEILDCFGLGETEKELVLTLIPASCVPALQGSLTTQLQLRRPGNGILFTLPIRSVSGAVAQSICYLTEKNRKEAPMEQSTHYHMIITIVNQGFANQVMEAAKSAGATGGTVLNARGLGSREAQEFLGIAIRPEKELVMILTRTDSCQSIMQAINSMHGLRSDARGILFSIPVESLLGLER